MGFLVHARVFRLLGCVVDIPNQRKLRSIQKMCDTVNTNIIDTEESPGQRRLHFEQDIITGTSLKLAPIIMTNEC